MSKVFRPRLDDWQGVLTFLRNGEEWHTATNSFSGQKYDPNDALLPYQGWMRNENYGRLEVHHKTRGIDFIVKSYDTVIAYRLTNGEWHVPGQKYSRTTSNHQGLIMAAIGVLGDKAA